jgi:glycosyltransferase involved in cell wall biosynthesis
LLARTSVRVHFAGPYVRRELYRLMAAIDWVVVPSIWWGNSPLVIEEAPAHRRPVVCSDIGGMAEKVRPGKDGFHFPVGDALTLARLLVRLAGDDAV